MVSRRVSGPTVLACTVLVVLSSTVVPVVAVQPAEPTARSGAPTDALDAPGSRTADQPSAIPTIRLTQTFSLTPERPGEVRVRLRYEIPNRTETLEATVPGTVSVVDTTAFRKDGPNTYQWDNETGTATITFTYEVNETTQVVGPEGAQGRYLFADVGEWALFRKPRIQTYWTWRGAPGVALDKHTATDGPGATGEWLVYLGETRRHERTAHGQTFTLVVPQRATMTETPDAVLDSLTTASDQFRVGDRDEHVYVFAAPTTQVEWGVRGLSYGDTDLWVRDEEPLSTAENTWLHEYVHSRQDFETTTATKWTTEAMATYYAAYLALEQDRISLAQFREHLERGTMYPQRASVLAVPSTWRNGANYLKGMLVAGELDRRIRLASGSTYSLQSVVSAMNAAETPVSQRTFLSLVGGVGDASTRRAAEAYTTTTEAPSVWSPSAHVEAFTPTPSRLSLQFTGGGEAIEVSGPFRTTTLSAPATVYVNESVTVTGRMVNAGGTAVDAVGILSVDGRDLKREETRLGPGESHTLTATHTFTETGEHTVSFGSDTMTVTVRKPATASVTASTVNRTELAHPGAVTLTATVSNNHSVPATKTVTFRRNGDGFAKRTVALGAGESTDVAVTVVLPADGEYVLRAGRGDAVRVVVGKTDGSGESSGDGDTAGDAGAGFTAATALLAIVAALAAATLRRRD